MPRTFRRIRGRTGRRQPLPAPGADDLGICQFAHRVWRRPVDIRSLEDLREADERTLRFTSSGFDTGGMLRPEDAAVYQQEVISHAELVSAVAESTRGAFERLRLLHAYGVLAYDMFTAADDLAHLVMEQALRDRFVEFHQGLVPFEDAHGTVHEVPATSFDALYEEIYAEGRLRKPQRWRLRLRRTGDVIYFDGMLDSLQRWARGEGLLRGQRNRHLEPVLRNFRNHVAHGGGHHLVMPVDSARTISDSAEIINQLWGCSTPGGRLYPAPIHREIQVVAWNSGGSVMSGLASLPPDPQFAEWTCVVVRAVLHDAGLARFDALYETTIYPCDLLWGPDSWDDAAAWLKRAQPAGDDVDVLDRLFLIQDHQGRVYLPRSPDVTAGLDTEEQQGIWYLIRADYPSDAIGHARALVAGQCLTQDGPCARCAAETVGTGSWQEMTDLAASAEPVITPRRPPDVKVPSIRAWPRYFESGKG